MHNPYLPKIARIKKIQPETADTKLFTFEFVNKKDRDDFNFQHGQFMMAGVLGFGEAAFDICSSTFETDSFELAIRNVGELTAKLHILKVGDMVTARGPFGNGLPATVINNRNLLLIGGGCGFVTMRSLVLDYLAGRLNPKNKIIIIYGCLNEKTLLFKDEYQEWGQKVDLKIALERPSARWPGARGVITVLFNNLKLPKKSVAILCGPPAMYKFIIEELKKRRLADSDIFLSLERRMYCGVGVCQHCAVGPYYVCKDGPVFCWEQIKNIPGAI